jgi:hypothetical protein
MQVTDWLENQEPGRQQSARRKKIEAANAGCDDTAPLLAALEIGGEITHARRGEKGLR